LKKLKKSKFDKFISNHYVNLTLSARITGALSKARKESKSVVPILVIRDKNKNRVSIIDRRDQERLKRYVDKIMKNWIDIVVEKILGNK
jgi:hypothetical protein